MTDSEALQLALSEGIINLDTIHKQIEEMQNKKFLEMHTYKIWQGSDGRWVTKLPADNSGNRRMIKKTNIDDLKAEIINYYKNVQEAKTLRNVFEEWINRKLKLNEICLGTSDRYKNEFDRYFKGSDLEKTQMDIITEDDLEDFIRETIADKGLTAKAYGNMRTLIIGTFKYAKRENLTDISISQFFGDLDLSKRAFRKTKKNPEDQVFTEEEAKKIIAWLYEHPSVENYGLIFAFQVGLRTAELAALKFSDIQGNKLHVQRQEIKHKDGVRHNIHEIVDYAKTDAGDRIVYLPQQAIDTVELIRSINRTGEYMMSLGNKKFYTNIFNHRIYKACDEVGIKRRSMHKIRKTYGTALIDSGADEGFIKNQMGHSDIETTRRYYYFSNKNEHKRIEQVEKAMAVFSVTECNQ